VTLTFLSCSHEETEPSVDNHDAGEGKIESFEISSFNEEGDALRATFSTSNFIYDFKVELSGEKYFSTFSVNSRGNTPPLTVDYVLDPTIRQWELDQTEKVLAASYGLNRDAEGQLAHFPEHTSAIDSFLNVVSRQAVSKSKLSLLAYHLSVFNTSKRSLSEDKGCAVYPFFLTGKSWFRCQEDVYYDREVIEKALSSIKENRLGDDGVEAVLKKTTSKKIPFKKLYSLIDKKVNLQRLIQHQKFAQAFVGAYVYNDYRPNYFTFAKDDYNDTPFFTLASDCSACFTGLCGSSLGCCGNYSGCCLYSSFFCLYHDLICLKCDKWHCGPACEPIEVLPDPSELEEPESDMPEDPLGEEVYSLNLNLKGAERTKVFFQKNKENHLHYV